MNERVDEKDLAWADTITDHEDIPTFDLTPESPDPPASTPASPGVQEGVYTQAQESQRVEPLPHSPTHHAAGTAAVQFPAPEVRSVQFAPFEETGAVRGSSNIDLLMDVPLPVVVELGHTSMLVKEILALGPGSIVELDKAAGENVDILVNGRLIARGEVVVIEENFGVRIVEFVNNVEKAVQ